MPDTDTDTDTDTDMDRQSKSPRAKSATIPTARRITGRSVIIGVAAALCAALVFRQTAVQILAMDNPQLALKLDRDDPVAVANATALRFGQSKATVSVQDLMQSGRGLLRVAPLDTRGLRFIAIGQETPGDPDRARPLFALAERITRRDFAAQIWWLQYFGRHNDYRTALDHMDIALRISGESATLMSPAIVKLLADRRVATYFSKYIRANPAWLNDFLIYAVAESDGVGLAHAVIAAGGLPPGAKSATIATALIQRLEVANQALVARDFYMRLPGAQHQALSDVGFGRANIAESFAPITWLTLRTPTAVSEFDLQDDGSIVLSAEVDADATAPVLQKLLYLAPGAYRWSVEHKFSAGEETSAIRWSMACLGASSPFELWTTDSPFNSAPVRMVEDFRVPAQCPAQRIVMTAIGGSGRAGATMTVQHPSLQSIGPSK